MELYCSLILGFDITCTGYVGDMEARASACVESALGYHTCDAGILTGRRETGDGTMSGGQFDWGGRLLKGSGGVQRLVQHGRKSCNECKRINQPNCETDKSSSNESWS